MLYVVIAVAIAIGGGILFAASRKPDTFTVTRTAVMPAAPSAIFPYINDMRKWNEWSPWARAEPDAKLFYEGPSEGMGAAFSWEGRKVGTGKMTVVESLPDERVTVRLDFLRPFKATSQASFILDIEGDTSFITWSMTGRNSFAAKLMNVFIDCEKMCGEQFDHGLDNLRALLSGT